MLTTKRKPATVGEILVEEFLQPMPHPPAPPPLPAPIAGPPPRQPPARA